jgi:curved DNA-binding protein CbpA
MLSYYQILGIKQDATGTEIEQAYKAHIKLLHPDRASSFGEEATGAATSAFKIVQEAYETLSDPVRRRSYDASLQGPAPKEPTREERYENLPCSQELWKTLSEVAEGQRSFYHIEEAAKRDMVTYIWEATSREFPKYYKDALASQLLPTRAHALAETMGLRDAMEKMFETPWDTLTQHNLLAYARRVSVEVGQLMLANTGVALPPWPEV